jgi:NTP pyrophosphatase (non-canonical NTP hydrolase)
LPSDLDALRERIRRFARERDWEKFHAPKNLASALIVEAAELLEHFQWMTVEQSRRLDEAAMREVEREMADVFIYLIRLSDVLGVDLLEAARRKVEINEQKYPADRVRGSARKYTEY